MLQNWDHDFGKTNNFPYMNQQHPSQSTIYILCTIVTLSIQTEGLS